MTNTNKQLTYSIILSLLTILVALCLTQSSHASFRKNLWPRWEVNDPLSNKTISHKDWQTFLENTVVTDSENINLIDYKKMSTKDVKRLNHYISFMSKVKISQYNRNEQLAFWINLYNALTVKLIIDHYPVSSIQDINISPGLFSIGPWRANLIRVENTALSLDDIHNRIIRPIWNDPRTHYAINNATIGAANLAKHAYLGNAINEQLNTAARNYINSLRGVQAVEKHLVVSKVYDWFEEDFGGTKQDVIIHLKLYANPVLVKKLATMKTISSYIYNWHLNNVNY